jgi:hypothetical protein
VFLEQFINFSNCVFVCLTVDMKSLRCILESISLVKTIRHVCQH